jgi:FKBP12-rapamycin complex-associated protein
MLPSLIFFLAQRNIEDILHAYLLATHYDPGWYKAWHTWALANFDVISYMEGQSDGKTSDIAGARLAVHVVQAVEGCRAVVVSKALHSSF